MNHDNITTAAKAVLLQGAETESSGDINMVAGICSPLFPLDGEEIENVWEHFNLMDHE